MENNARSAFNQQLDTLQKEMLPALTDNQLKEIVIFKKLLEIENKLDKLITRIDKYNREDILSQ
ncbi:MAG: hypothetical protein ABIO46_16215 [Chitinophagales bacterium]